MKIASMMSILEEKRHFYYFIQKKTDDCGWDK